MKIKRSSFLFDALLVLTLRWWRNITGASRRSRTWRRSWTTRPTLWPLTDATSLRCVPPHTHILIMQTGRVTKHADVFPRRKSAGWILWSCWWIRSTSASVTSSARCSALERWICTRRMRWAHVLRLSSTLSHTSADQCSVMWDFCSVSAQLTVKDVILVAVFCTAVIEIRDRCVARYQSRHRRDLVLRPQPFIHSSLKLRAHLKNRLSCCTESA